MNEATSQQQETAHAARNRAPEPEPIRFYGTTWVDHSDGYLPRRIGLTVATFLAVAVGGVLLVLGYQGLEIASVGTVLNVLVVGAFAACTALAFGKTWSGFVRRREGPADDGAERSMHSIRGIGFVGVLLAYGIRSLMEAPGEKLRRAEYDAAVRQYERRRTTRTGNPAIRAKAKSKRRR